MVLRRLLMWCDKVSDKDKFLFDYSLKTGIKKLCYKLCHEKSNQEIVFYKQWPGSSNKEVIIGITIENKLACDRDTVINSTQNGDICEYSQFK